MTDPNPPTELDEIVVIGQRRRYHTSLFPSGGWEGAGETGGLIRETGDADQGGGDNTDPCANPETALDWNADAAAAEALRRFQVDALDPLLDGQERHFVIYRDPTTGQIRLGNMAVGPNMGGEVTPDMSGINMRDVIGAIHSHPGSGPYPSGPDRSNFTNFWQEEVGNAGGDPTRF